MWSEPSFLRGTARLGIGTPRQWHPLSSGPTFAWRQPSLSADLPWQTKSCSERPKTLGAVHVYAQCSYGTQQRPEAACPLYVAHQPVLEASVMTTTCRDTCSEGTPTCRKTSSVQGLNEQKCVGVMVTRTRLQRHAISGLESVSCAEVVPYEAIRVERLQLRMPYAPGASASVSVVPPSCL